MCIYFLKYWDTRTTFYCRHSGSLKPGQTPPNLVNPSISGAKASSSFRYKPERQNRADVLNKLATRNLLPALRTCTISSLIVQCLFLPSTVSLADLPDTTRSKKQNTLFPFGNAHWRPTARTHARRSAGRQPTRQSQAQPRDGDTQRLPLPVSGPNSLVSTLHKRRARRSIDRVARPRSFL